MPEASGYKKNMNYPAYPKTPVFIHSSFRTASTWVWSRFRRTSGAVAFYEIFNDALATMDLATAANLSPQSWESSHPPSAPYFLEFLPFIQDGVGVQHFDASMAYKRFIPTSGPQGAITPAEERYVAGLIEYVADLGKVPVLTAVRSLGRVHGLKTSFPGFHILLYRNLYQQWCSYSDQAVRGDLSFIRSVQTILSENAHDGFIRNIGSLFPLAEPRPDNINYFYSFVLLHLYLYIHAAEAADLIVDVNELACDDSYRSAIEHQISDASGLVVDLSGARESRTFSLVDVPRPDTFLETIDIVFAQVLATAGGTTGRDFVRKARIDLANEFQQAHRYNGALVRVLSGPAGLLHERDKLKSIVERGQESLCAKDTEIGRLQDQVAAAEAELSSLQDQLRQNNELSARTTEGHAAAIRAKDDELERLRTSVATAEAELSSLQDQLRQNNELAARATEEHAAAIRAKDDELERLRTSVATTKEKIFGLQESLGTARAAVHHRDMELEQFVRHVQELTAQIDAAADQHARLHQLLAAVNQSTSWRITAPLRITKVLTRWLALGSWAWITLRPGSRPRRFLSRLASRNSRLEISLADVSSPGSPAGLLAHETTLTADPIELAFEPRSVRLTHLRLSEAVRRWQEHPDATWRTPASNRPRLAYVSPLPPARTGIADYSAEMIPALAKHYDIDAIVDQDDVCDSVANFCSIRDSAWFEHHAHSYDQIVYHVGNSYFHRYMFPLLKKYPGIVVLHDLYLSHIVADLELNRGWKGYWSSALCRASGYKAVQERYTPNNIPQAILNYPANIHVLQHAQGVIVHSNFSRKLAEEFFRADFLRNWKVIPLARRLPERMDRQLARSLVGFKNVDFALCSFGMLGETKMNTRLLEAWLASSLASNPSCRLVFVGELASDAYCHGIMERIARSGLSDRIHVTGFANPDLYRAYLSAADAAVQLRTHSRGETSAAVLDCMGYGLPTIVNAHGSMAELPRDKTIQLADRFSDRELTAAIEHLYADHEQRADIGERARVYVGECLSPDLIADEYRAAFGDLVTQVPTSFSIQKLVTFSARHVARAQQPEVMLEQARWLAREGPIKIPLKQFLVDVSELARGDLRTGIQRVVRAQLLALLESPPEGFLVEPIWLSSKHGQSRYFYARRFTADLLSFPEDILDDDPVEVSKGDVFFGADLHHGGVINAADAYTFKEWRAEGVNVFFQVFDVLPLTIPECFPEGTDQMHARWLTSVALNADGLVCISEAVAHETHNWIRVHAPQALPMLNITAVHLGADIEASAPTRGLPDSAHDLLRRLRQRPTFLMVGTIEPRKGYLQTLAAFEHLWAEDIDVNLVIVGSEGWKALPDDQRRTIPETTQRIRRHLELSKRLFWLEGVSDEYLDLVYVASTCLIAASEDEGFGLPLIEAARHNVPILARDIPVFREIAGTSASYFRTQSPADLATVLKAWLVMFAEGRHPRSEGMPWLSWAEHARRLKSALIAERTGSDEPVGITEYARAVE